MKQLYKQTKQMENLLNEGILERGSKLLEFKTRILNMNNRQLKQYVEILRTELTKRNNQ